MIFAIQMDRVGALYAGEKNSNTHNSRTEKEIRLANEILKTMADAESKRKRYAPPLSSTGPSGGVLNQMEQLKEIYRNKYGQSISRVILADDARRRVLNALEHLRKGDSQALQNILETNAEKAQELEEQEKQRAFEEAETIDVEVK